MSGNRPGAIGNSHEHLSFVKVPKGSHQLEFGVSSNSTKVPKCSIKIGFRVPKGSLKFQVKKIEKHHKKLLDLNY